MVGNRRSQMVVAAVLFVVLAILACGPAPGAELPTIAITEPSSGATVAVGEQVQIVSTASADGGVDRVELAINGQVVRTDTPPQENLSTFSLAQPWTPVIEGQVTVSAVVYDAEGQASEPATITLSVVPAVAAEEGETSTATPTPEPEPGVTPTPVPDVTSEAGCTLNASFGADVTVPDDTEFSPGDSFIKTWRIRNSGTCDWGSGFNLVFVGGDQMGGTPSVAVSATAAGSTADVSVNLTAPAEPGTYRGNWRMQSDTGTVFGSTIYVQIVVPSPVTDTPTPTLTPTIVTPTPTATPTIVTTTPTPTPTPTEETPSSPPFTEYVYKQVNVAAGASGAAIATCPAGSVVVGGGYAANSDVAFYTQYRFENGWRGDATNNAGATRQITVYAVCLHNAEGASITHVHGQVEVPPGTNKQAVATCPAGSIATGGGFHAYPDGSLRVYNSSKADSGEGWQSWAHNNSGSTKTHHAYAMCLSGTGGTTARIMQSATISAGDTGYAVPTCGSGALVTGGGFAAQTDLIIYSNSGPYSEDEWRVYVRNTHGSEDRLLFGYAVCLTLP